MEKHRLNPHSVYVDEVNLFGEYLYRVVVDGYKYDEFFSRTRLTWSEQVDVAEYYREGLTGYIPPDRVVS